MSRKTDKRTRRVVGEYLAWHRSKVPITARPDGGPWVLRKLGTSTRPFVFERPADSGRVL